MSKSAILALEDGTCFYGEPFGAEGETSGEVVFNTSMSGYQEILTDPSYCGQIIVMTYPHIGNYGINSDDVESGKPHLRGFAAREFSKHYSNWRSEKSLEQYLKENKIVAIEQIDTRALVKHIRSKGAMKGVISTEELNPQKAVLKAKNAPGIVGIDLVKNTTCRKIYEFNKPSMNVPIIAVIDCGIKLNILKSISKFNCRITVFPANASHQEIINSKPDGLIISNGPGDPAAVTYVIDTVKKIIELNKIVAEGKNLTPNEMRGLIKPIPILGICLGHQIIALACGGKTYKLKFGHRGANQPVKNLKTNRIEITSENHGFAVDIDTIAWKFKPTYINLNDGTLEGMSHRELPVFSVQFHPEASPGPHDTLYIYEEFYKLIKYPSPPPLSRKGRGNIEGHIP
ncbi:MAG: glutamine-hydrolyzing carbamoyl-phosphate synthase small subunit [Elusimicrobiota bacterium]